ncbi:hypothetical protein FLP41_14385 [Paracoccus marcusii]|uniref:hypothetical protein n=1 Tax=Paracoccus marcusii TaxID=59779 RepID=UPI002ED1417B|nr:hypothetical protein FLP41_14385 [Paracoccus marcusii]
MQLFGRDAKGDWNLDETSAERRLVCRSGNPGAFRQDRSGRLDVTEPPDLGALIAKIDGRAPAHPANPPDLDAKDKPMSYDLNDAQPQMAPSAN